MRSLFRPACMTRQNTLHSRRLPCTYTFSPTSRYGKLFLSIELDTDHHAVGHSFCARVDVAGVLDVSHVVSDGEIDLLTFLKEKAIDDGAQLLLDLHLTFADLIPYVAVYFLAQILHFFFSFPQLCTNSTFVLCKNYDII